MNDKLHLFGEQTTRIVKFDFPIVGCPSFPNDQERTVYEANFRFCFVACGA